MTAGPCQFKQGLVVIRVAIAPRGFVLRKLDMLFFGLFICLSETELCFLI